MASVARNTHPTGQPTHGLAWQTVGVPTPRPEPSLSTPCTEPIALRRRLTAVLVTATALVLATGPGAFAGSRRPAASAGATNPNLGPANPGTPVCTINNTNLDEVTGIVATAQGIYAVEGGDTFDPNSVQVWTINPTNCQATSRNYGFDPADPQDLALGADGALWVADIGDGVGDDNQRDWVTMERVDLSSSAQAVPHRTLFPDSGKINARAVLLQQDNAPIVIANGAGKAILYRPDGPLQAGASNGLPKLTQVGEFTPAKTETPNPLGTFGKALVTGAATSPDRTRVVIRTVSDAYEFKIGADGDVVKAITKGTPVITPLPNEENGQAISYSADGKTFLTLGSVEKPVLRSYTPFVPPAPTSNATVPAAEGSDGLSFSDITNIAAAAGFVGFLAVVAGVIGIYRARRQYRERGGWSEERGTSGTNTLAPARVADVVVAIGAAEIGPTGAARTVAAARCDPIAAARVSAIRTATTARSGCRGPGPDARRCGDPPTFRVTPAAARTAGTTSTSTGANGTAASPIPNRGPAADPSTGANTKPATRCRRRPRRFPARRLAGPPPRPRPSSGGQVYGRPRQEPDDGNDAPRRGGYGHDNIDH